MSNRRVPLSDTDKRDLAKAANDRMEDVRKALADSHQVEQMREFLDEFAVCETGYKVLLQRYLESAGEKVDWDKLAINGASVRHVLQYAGITLDDQTRKTIFNKYRDKTHELQAKGLRNNLAHEPKENDLALLTNRFDELMAAMRTFETAIAQVMKTDKSAHEGR